jgi:hypothetical protein
MALPLIAAGIAARAVAKKLASRAAGGITGAGAKQVAPVYREMGTGNVTKIPSITKNQQKVVNQMTTSGKKFIKSGNVAKVKAQAREGENLLIPKKPTVKINSNPMRGK